MSIIAGYMVPNAPILLEENSGFEEQELIKTREAYEKIAREIAELKPDTIIITSPYTTMYADYLHVSPGTHAVGELSQFGVKEGKVEAFYDEAFTRKLNFNLKVRQFPGGILGERFKELDHGTIIPLLFLQKYYKEFQLVRTGVSGLSAREHYEFGQVIQKTAKQLNRRIVIIASEAAECDKDLIQKMENGEFLSLFDCPEEPLERIQEHGHQALFIMAGALDQKAVTAHRLSYEKAVEFGYGICSFVVTGEDENRDFLKQYEVNLRLAVKNKQESEDAYVALARAAMNGYLTKGKVVVPGNDIPTEMKEEKAGVFVSIKKDGRLRGCAGSLTPEQNSIAEEIVNHAVGAACFDTRFAPITKEELSEVTISVDVLKTPEEITSVKELDPTKYGVIVSAGSKSGLMLPNLIGVTKATQQVEIAKQKAQISENEQVSLKRFEVIRHE